MTIQVIALVTLNEDEPIALAAYLDATTPLLAQAGAKIVRHFNVVDVVVGTTPAKSMIIIEYPSRAAVDLVFGSEAYKRIIPYRDLAFLDYHVSIVASEQVGDAQQTHGSGPMTLD